MSMYEKPYKILFNAITDALEEMCQWDSLKVKKILIEAQQRAEEEYIKSQETTK